MSTLTLFALPLFAFALPFAMAVVMPNWISWAGYIAFVAVATTAGLLYLIYESGIEPMYGLVVIGLIFVAVAGAINGVVSRAIMLALPTGMLGKTIIAIVGLAAGFYTVPLLARLVVGLAYQRGPV